MAIHIYTQSQSIATITAPTHGPAYATVTLILTPTLNSSLSE